MVHWALLLPQPVEMLMGMRLVAACVRMLCAVAVSMGMHDRLCHHDIVHPE